MGKRKRSRDREYDHIIRKLKKLSKKRRRSLSSSESDNSNYENQRYYETEHHYDEYQHQGNFANIFTKKIIFNYCWLCIIVVGTYDTGIFKCSHLSLTYNH